MMADGEMITPKTGYLAMMKMAGYDYDVFGAEAIINLMSDGSWIDEHGTLDPAFWADWLDALDHAKRGEVDANFLFPSKH